MGSSESSDSEKEETEKIIFDNYDSSFIYSAILILYYLSDFRKYITEKDYAENSGNKNQELGKLLKKIFVKDNDNINLEKYAKKIYLLITKKYQLEIIASAGKILILLLEILNYEENGGIINIWENSILQNNQLFQNIFNQEQAFNDFVRGNKENHDTKMSDFFRGILLKRKKVLNMNYIYIFSSYFVYELDLPYISTSLSMKDNKIKNIISLQECVLDMRTAKYDIFNGQPCYTDHFMYDAPPLLIFFLNRGSDSNTFNGDITFKQKDDFSIFFNKKEKDQVIKYKLISLIKEKKINVKKKKNEDNTKDEQIVEDNNYGKTQDKFLFIYREDKQYYYYDNIKRKSIKIEIEENDKDYYNHVLVYKKYNKN